MGKARTLNSHLIINALIHIDIRSMILLGFSSRHGAKHINLVDQDINSIFIALPFSFSNKEIDFSMSD